MHKLITPQEEREIGVRCKKFKGASDPCSCHTTNTTILEGKSDLVGD